MTHTHSIDLHGLNMSESRRILDSLFDWLKLTPEIHKLEIIVGIGKGSISGPVLPSFVINYLRELGLTGENTNGVIKLNLNTKKHKS